MLSSKSKGKRPIVNDSDDMHTRKKSTDGGIPKIGAGANINNLSEAQQVKEMDNETEVDVKVPLPGPQGLVAETASEGQMVESDKQLNDYDHEIMVIKDELKSVKEALSSMGNKFASFEASFLKLQQYLMPKHSKGLYASPSNAERRQSSTSKKLSGPFICEICTEEKTVHKSFRIRDCPHAYCIDCMVKYVVSKLQENIPSIPCPVADCGALLEPEYCRDILPKDVFDRWGIALCEAVILGAQKFYCPFKDCSAMLIDDGGEVVRESECPYCRRLFCAQCNVPWHSGIKCVEFQKLNKDERDRGHTVDEGNTKQGLEEVS